MLLAVLLLAIVGVILIRTKPVQHFLLRRVEALAARAGVPFRAEEFQVRLLDRTVTLSGFLYDTDGVQVRVANLSVELPWTPYGADGIVINSLVADGVDVLVRSPGGSPPSGKGAALPPFRVDRLDIQNGSFTYQSPSTRLEIPSFSVRATDGEGEVRVGAPITIQPDTRFRVEQIPIHLASRLVQFGPLQWSADYLMQQGSGSAAGTFEWSPSVTASVNFETNRIDIEKWTGVVAGGTAVYQEGVLNVSEFHATRGKGRVSGSAQISDPGKSASVRWDSVGLAPAGLQGETTGEMNLQWTASDFSDLGGRGRLSINVPEYGNAQSDVRIADQKVRLAVRAASNGAVIRANVVTGLDRRLAGTFSLTHMEYGSVTAEGTLGGTIAAPVAEARATAHEVTFSGVGPVDGSASVSYRDKTLLISEIDARLKNSHIPEGSLRIDLTSRAIEGSIPTIDTELNDFLPDGRGPIQASAQVSGSLDHPLASISASSPGVDIGGTHIESVSAEAVLEDRILTVTQLIARQEQGVLEASGTANLETEQVRGQAKVSNLQITQVRGLSATVGLNAEITGTTRKPSATATGELANVVYQGQEHGNVEFTGTFDGSMLDAHLQSSRYNATVDGAVRLEAPYPFTATVVTDSSKLHYKKYDAVADGRAIVAGALQPLSVERLQLDAFRLTGEGVQATAEGSLDTGVQADVTVDLAALPVEGAQLSGQAQASVVVKGTIENPSIDGTLRTTNATVRTAGMPEPANVAAVVDFTKDRFSVREMRADLADAQVVISGEGSVKGSGEFAFRATNIRPERFLPERPLSGVIALEGKIRAGAPRVDAIEGEASVTDLDLTAGGVEFHQTQPGEIALADKVVSIRNFVLTGPETEASVSGTVKFEGAGGDLDLKVVANTNLRILDGFIPRSNALGRIESDVAVHGTFKQPDMNGFVSLTNAQIQIAQPQLFLSDMNARVQLTGDRFRIEQATGDLNGGEFNASGEAGISISGLKGAAIEVSLAETQLEYPEGLQSQVSAQLSVGGSSPNLVITGNVEILDALYRRDIDLRKEVLDRLTPQAARGTAGLAEPSLAQKTSLDINVQTNGPVAVANNLANIDLTGNFRVRGTIADPVILGRAVTLEGGEVYFGPQGAEATALGERQDRYIVERGTVDFNNAAEPVLDFEATHELQVKDERYLIRLRAFGTPANLRTELTSDPTLDEQDIIVMLLTGRSFKDLQSSYLTVSREQLFSYLSGQLTSRFFRGAGSALGLDTVTIEPVTLASEEDVSARLTVGKDITNDLSLIYSQNLASPQNRDQAWILNYSTFKDLVLRGINRTDQNLLRFEVRHGLEFGGGPALPRHVAPGAEARLDTVTFSPTSFTREDLAKHVAKTGNPYNIYRMNDDVRSLRQFLASNGYPNARVRARRNVSSGMADVTFAITEGPKITFEYRGSNVPKDVQKQVVQVWQDGFGEASSAKESSDLLLRYFRDEGYLQAAVSARNESQNPDERLYVFQIDAGRKFRKPTWMFEGVEELDITDSAGKIMEDPSAIQEQIELELQSKGFLDATSTVPELVLEKGPPHFAVTVVPGVQFAVRELHYTGNSFFTNAELNRAILLGPSKLRANGVFDAGSRPETEEALKLSPYTSDWGGTARRRLLTAYWQQGFNDVQVSVSSDHVPGSGSIDLFFQIQEGERQKISDVEIRGDSKTALSHVRRYLEFKKDDPVDYARINLSRKKLYDTGLFKRVDIDVSNETSGYVAHVKLNERAPWDVKYGFTVTDHQDQNTRDLGFSSEATHRNIFGKGITAGTSLKADPSLREARLFSSLPVFLGRDVSSTGTLFRTRETLTDSISNTWGFTLQQQWRLSDLYVLSYDYSYRRVATFERDLTDDDPEIVNGIVPVARFNATVSRDTRDDIFNATRGTFFSNSFQLAPPGVGSSIRFVRNYTQYLRFRELEKPRLIWASAYRLGLARGFGNQELTQTDQFNAAVSLRAFGSDSQTLKPGNALFVTNQELRTPLFWRLGAVGFIDVGNVYQHIGNSQLLKQRYSPGFGLRLNTPFLLLRADVGFNPWARPGESRRTISWGIGQSF